MRLFVLPLALGLAATPVWAAPPSTSSAAPSFEQKFPKSLAQMDRIQNPDVRALMKAAIRRSGLFYFPTLSPDGKVLLYLADRVGATVLERRDEQVRLVRLSQQQDQNYRPTNDAITPLAAAFSPDRTLMATPRFAEVGGLRSWNAVSLFDARTWKVVHTFPTQTNSIWSLAFSRDGKRLLSGDAGGGVCIYDVVSGKMLAQWHFKNYLKSIVVGWVPTAQGETPVALTLNPWNGGWSVPELQRQTALKEPSQLWNVADNFELARFPSIVDARAAAFSPDGLRIAILGWKGTPSLPAKDEARILITRWNEARSAFQPPQINGDFIWSQSTLHWTPDGRTLIASGLGFADEWFQTFEANIPASSPTP